MSPGESRARVCGWVPSAGHVSLFVSVGWGDTAFYATPSTRRERRSYSPPVHRCALLVTPVLSPLLFFGSIFLQKQGNHSRQCRRAPRYSVLMVCRARISGRNADPTTSRARAVPYTQKQVSSSYLLCGKSGCLCGNYACKVLHSARERANEHIKRTSRAKVMLDCLQTARHPHEQKGLGRPSSVMERFEQVPLQFSAQVGREETDSEVRS